MNWACLLKRVFKSDLAACPDCGGELKIIAAITQPSVITKLLTHFGLPTHARTATCPGKTSPRALLRLLAPTDLVQGELLSAWELARDGLRRHRLRLSAEPTKGIVQR